MYYYCPSYAYHTYKNLNKDPKCTVMVYSNHTCNDPNKQPEGNGSVLAIPNTPAMI